MSPLPRRVRGGALVATVAVGAFVAGTAVGGSSTGLQEPVAPASVLDEAADRIMADAARPVQRDVLERAAVDGMLKALGDRWSAYYEPSEFASFTDALEGRYTGVGLWLRQDSDARLLVSGVQEGAPAARVGVRVGDEVVSVDGVDVVGEPVSDVLSRLRGADGSDVRVGFRRADGTHVVTLQREVVATEDVTVDRLRNQVLMIRVAGCTRGVGRQVRVALAADRAGSRGGIVLDLRGNAGGLVDEA
ncbi:MAG: PDZ domain-containing protein, partial [Actinomycetia bacterium]|nr:PDZ domain-containing protein [Actinomycetes bacterium]